MGKGRADDDAVFQCRTCVAVKELPMRTDVEIELIAHLYVSSFFFSVTRALGFEGIIGVPVQLMRGLWRHVRPPPLRPRHASRL